MALPQTVNSHKIQMLCLSILHVSAWACLIRSDYNFVLIMFAYFIFVSSRQYHVTNVIFYLTIILIILDIAFFVFVPKAWMSIDQNNSIWNNLRTLHGFVIFCSVIILLLKIPLLYYLYEYKKQIQRV